MNKDKILNEPLPILVAYLTTLYEDFQCPCMCKKECLLCNEYSEEEAVKYSKVYEKRCKENNGYENCIERQVYERVIKAVSKGTNK